MRAAVYKWHCLLGLLVLSGCENRVVVLGFRPWLSWKRVADAGF
jgi:hypothetical protein